MFWVYAGTNNYLVGGLDPTIAPAEIGAALERLYHELGARRFAVPNLFEIGDVPLFLGEPQAVKDGLNAVSGEHNVVLAGVLAEFAADHPDASVVPVDVFGVFPSAQTQRRVRRD